MIYPTGAERSDGGLSTAEAANAEAANGDVTADASDATGPARAPTEDRFEAAGVVGSAPEPVAGEAVTHCPVCAFGSDERDDVYAHLLTAHRKSTISDALLEES